MLPLRQHPRPVGPRTLVLANLSTRKEPGRPTTGCHVLRGRSQLTVITPVCRLDGIDRRAVVGTRGHSRSLERRRAAVDLRRGDDPDWMILNGPAVESRCTLLGGSASARWRELIACSPRNRCQTESCSRSKNASRERSMSLLVAHCECLHCVCCRKKYLAVTNAITAAKYIATAIESRSLPSVSPK